MNEQLMQELVLALKEAKSNLNPAFAELIRQYSTLYSNYAYNDMMFVLICIFTGLVSSFVFFRVAKIDGSDVKYMTLFGAVIGVFLSIVVCSVNTSNYFNHSAIAASPLGYIMDSYIK